MILGKPKFWDLKKPNFFAYFFMPLTMIIKVNNYLIDNYSLKKKSKKIKTICIGNIYVGGTGKTPTTIKLFKLLKKLNIKIFTAKKYYKEQKDEQILLKNKTNFIQSKNRSEIVKIGEKNNAKLIIFDDGLQERKIDYDIKFACFDINNWIGNGQLIPSGPLRENLNSLSKFDAVFLKGNKKNSKNILKQIKSINHKIKIFYTNFKILNLQKFNLKKNYLIFSGIGNPNSFKNILIKNKFRIINHLIYPDHYEYSSEEIQNIKLLARKSNAKIITTEKDFVKISKKDQKKIDFLDLDLKIENEKELITFIKFKLNGNN